jgi:phage-related protein
MRLTYVVKYDYTCCDRREKLKQQTPDSESPPQDPSSRRKGFAVVGLTRPVSWIKSARKEFERFPIEAQTIFLAALTMAGEGAKADIAKPFKGLGSGVFEIALPFRGNAFRVVYCVQLADAVWVIHAFQKKSTQGIKTPQHEIDLIKSRLKLLREMLE